MSDKSRISFWREANDFIKYDLTYSTAMPRWNFFKAIRDGVGSTLLRAEGHY